MPLRVATPWPWLLLTLAACALFIALGRWQWQRGEYRTSQWQAFAAGAAAPVDAGSAELANLQRYTRVRLRGVFDADRQLLLDNISQGGRAGYYVLTPLRLEDGGHVLVNRGFVPGSGYRERLPDIAIANPAAMRTLTGRLGTLPVAGVAAGHVPPPATGPWPRSASFPTAEDLAAALAVPLAPGVLLLDAAADAGDGATSDATPGGLVRNWQPPGLDPARHYSYAVQWWAFAALALVLFVVLNFRRKKTS